MDKLQTIKLQAAKYSCEILPNYGAALQSYKFDNQEFVLGYQTKEDILKAQYKGVLLAPFPNRLAKASYSFFGKNYVLPINRAKEGLSLHGFLYDKVFAIEYNTNNEVELAYTYNKQLDGYPFSFLLRVRYKLCNDGTLHVNTIVKNVGEETLPFGLGWHPYFTINQDIDSLYIEVDAMEQLALDNKKIPTGKSLDFTLSQQIIALNGNSFDDCFRFLAEKENSISLQSNQYVLQVKMNATEFPYLQLFIPKERNSIAIEPMTCPPDAFNSGLDLWELGSNEERSASYNIRAYSL